MDSSSQLWTGRQLVTRLCGGRTSLVGREENNDDGGAGGRGRGCQLKDSATALSFQLQTLSALLVLSLTNSRML